MKVVQSLFVVAPLASAFSIASTASSRPETALSLGGESDSVEGLERRKFLSLVPAALAASQLVGQPEVAKAVTGAADGNLPDLPSEAVRSYLQYRIPLQIAADYYVFELQAKVGDIENWGEIGELFRVNNNRGKYESVFLPYFAA